MKHKITASSLFQRQYLIVHSKGVKFYENRLFGHTRRFGFDLILCVLQSPDNTLSIQVGREVFSIRTKPDNKKHQAAIAALLQELQRTCGTSGTDAPAAPPIESNQYQY